MLDHTIKIKGVKFRLSETLRNNCQSVVHRPQEDLRSLQKAQQVKTIFIKILTHYSLSSRCWHLHWCYKSNSGQTVGVPDGRSSRRLLYRHVLTENKCQFLEIILDEVKKQLSLSLDIWIHIFLLFCVMKGEAHIKRLGVSKDQGKAPVYCLRRTLNKLLLPWKTVYLTNYVHSSLDIWQICCQK